MAKETQAFWRDYGPEARRGGYVAAMVVNTIVLYAAHHLLEWGVPFITPSFNEVLWAIDLSIGATILAYALFIVYDAAWFRHVTQIVLDGLALLSVYTLYIVFPFAFDVALWDDIVSIALLITMIGLAIALIVQVVRALADPGWWQEEALNA